MYVPNFITLNHIPFFPDYVFISIANLRSGGFTELTKSGSLKLNFNCCIMSRKLCWELVRMKCTDWHMQNEKLDNTWPSIFGSIQLYDLQIIHNADKGFWEFHWKTVIDQLNLISWAIQIFMVLCSLTRHKHSP